MKFIIFRTSKHGSNSIPPVPQATILTTMVNSWDGEEYYIWEIEFNSLEELCTFQSELDKNIIIREMNYNIFWEIEETIPEYILNMKVIEIYDTYRE